MNDITNCSNLLRQIGEPYPRTCKVCGLSGCKFLSKFTLVEKDLKPIDTAPKNRYILLAGDSGYSSTPLRFDVCKFYPDYQPPHQWRNYAGDSFMDFGSLPRYWMEIPQI